MNNERVTILYAEQVKVFEKQKECLEEFKKAIDSANKIKTLNSQEENVSKIINNFTIIQDNNKTLIKEMNDAIEHIKKTSSTLSLVMFTTIFLSCFVSVISLGYLTFTSYLQNNVFVNEINNIKELSLKKHKELEQIKLLKKNGFEILDTAILFPKNAEVQENTQGRKGIWFEDIPFLSKPFTTK